jgi:hypothetical protein
LYFSIPYSGAATMGKTIAKMPKPHRIPMPLRTSSEAFEPAKAVMMYGDDVKAYAKPRLFNFDASAVITSTQYVMPPNPRL